MADDIEIPPKSRRAFVKTVGQVAVTAPAVGLLLNSSTMAQAAVPNPYASQLHILDDFTFGNTTEDIDALHTFQSNFNPNNATANQDDHV
jgi:hypothetical protein